MEPAPEKGVPPPPLGESATRIRVPGQWLSIPPGSPMGGPVCGCHRIWMVAPGAAITEALKLPSAAEATVTPWAYSTVATATKTKGGTEPGPPVTRVTPSSPGAPMVINDASGTGCSAYSSTDGRLLARGESGGGIVIRGSAGDVVGIVVVLGVGGGEGLGVA